MNIDKVDAVVYLCEKFKLRAEKWKEAESKCRIICPKESAALRRVSMELTRALADMRRP